MREIPRPGVAEPSGAPKVLGKYRCDDRLAGDGWLEIHRGRVQGLAGFDRLFAIVSLAPGALSRRSQAAENLLRAARLSATVQDTRLAAITDSGLAPGSAFVVTELVHGVSLRALSSHLHGNVRTARRCRPTWISSSPSSGRRSPARWPRLTTAKRPSPTERWRRRR